MKGIIKKPKGSFVHVSMERKENDEETGPVI